MKTLLELYQKRENELKNQLMKASSISQYVEKIQDEINRLRDIKSEYIGELTPSEANIALKGLEEINESIILLKAVENVQVSFSEPLVSKGTSESAVSTKSTHQSLIAVAVVSGSAGSIVGNFVGGLLSTKEQAPPRNFLKELHRICQPYPKINESFPDFAQKIKSICSFEQALTNDAIILTSPVITGFLFGGIVAGIVAVFLLSLLNRKQRLEKPKATTQLTQTHKNELEETINAILCYFQRQLEAIDNEIAKEGRKTPPKPSSPNIEDHPELLGILQNLIGLEANPNKQVNSSRSTRSNLIQQIQQFLLLNEIEVIFDEPGVNDPDLSKFDFVTSSDEKLKEHLTLIPAFVKNNHVILRGRVIKPKSV